MFSDLLSSVQPSDGVSQLTGCVPFEADCAHCSMRIAMFEARLVTMAVKEEKKEGRKKAEPQHW
jgi:hypothetical protein